MLNSYMESAKIEVHDFGFYSCNRYVHKLIFDLRFKTTRQTLCSDGSSMLAAMFAPDSKMAPGILTDGAYFLDRDPKVFEVKKWLPTSKSSAIKTEKDSL